MADQETGKSPEDPKKEELSEETVDQPEEEAIADGEEDAASASDDEPIPDFSADMEAAAAYVEAMRADELSQEAGEGSSEKTAKKPEGRFTTTQMVCMAIAAAATVICIICLGIYASTPIDHGSAANTSGAVNTANASSAANTAQTTAADNTAASSASSSAAVAQADQILPDSNARYYTKDELEALSDRELYLARNEIYARHGRGFKNQDLVDWFAGKDWYEELYTPEEYDALPDQRNEYEHANADLMMEIEQERDSPYL